ncbi:MAG TPA: substrate-binding domain-containing protein [Pseudonocardiaceae bacterium]
MESLQRVLQSLLDFFGAGNLALGIVLLVATPYVDRLLIRRKRIGVRVQYKSRIGLGPGIPRDDHDTVRRLLGRWYKLNERMSTVVIRVRNTGSEDVEADDFRKQLSFQFGHRIVWNAEIREQSSSDIQAHLELAADTGRRATLDDIQTGLSAWMSQWLGEDGERIDIKPELRWPGVRLDDLELPTKSSFKIVVVLLDPASGATEDQLTWDGKLKSRGLIIDERMRRRITLQRVTAGFAAVLTVILLLYAIIPAPPPRPVPADPTVACGSGELKIVGSTVFTPVIPAIGAEYSRVCGGARISTQPTGSIEGARDVAQLDPNNAGGLAALSDGRQDGIDTGLHAEQVAIVVYHVVVHSAVGLDAITSEQLRGIYNGTYRDWSQLRPGEPLPIRIVGRGQDSGTRELFEKKVLGATEGSLSSNDCLTRDRDRRAPTIRCERTTNIEVVRQISQTPGAIGYADAMSVAEARKTNAIRALILDGRVFDVSAGVNSGDPFWTVEYLYTRTVPGSGTLLAGFSSYLRLHMGARGLLRDAGYLPCAAADGTRLVLCDYR